MTERVQYLIAQYMAEPLRQEPRNVGVIARLGDRHELLPRTDADKVRERDASLIVLDHGLAATSDDTSVNSSEDEAYYAQFKVPDDLVW